MNSVQKALNRLQKLIRLWFGRLRRHPKSFVILFAALVFTVLSWRYTQNAIHQLAEMKFEDEVGDTMARIRNRVDLHVSTLHGARGLYAGSERVERHEWRAFVQGDELSEIYPGVVATGFVQYVSDQERDGFVESVRSDKSINPEGFPHFDIYPAGKRSEYLAVKFIEPMVGNERLLGLDLAFDPRRWSAIQKAVDNGEPAASQRVDMVHGEAAGSLFEIYLAIYGREVPVGTFQERRSALRGFVYSVFDMNDLMSGIFGGIRRRPAIDFEIFDGDILTEENLIYEGMGFLRTVDFDFKPRFTVHKILMIGQRPWSLRFISLPGFGLDFPEELLPALVLFSGLAFSFLVFVVLYSLAISHAREMKMAELAAIVESSDDAVISMNLQGTVASWNPAAERIYGYESREVVSRSFSMLMLPENLKELPEVLDRMKREERINYYETVRLRKDGRRIHVSSTISPIKDPAGVLKGISTIDRDITQLKQVGELLQQSREFYLTLFEEFPAMVWRSVIGGGRDYFNKTWCSFTGRSPDQERDHGWNNRIHPEDIDRYLQVYQRALQDRQPYQIEYRLRRFDDQYRWLSENGHPFNGPDGRFSGLIGYCSDVTDRKRAEEDLRHSLDLLFGVVENIPAMICLKDAVELRYELFNKAGEDLLGHRREELMGKNDYDFFPRERADVLTANDYQILREGEMKDVSEEVVQTKEKGQRILHTKKVPILKDAKGNPMYLLGISEDITDRKRAEEALRESEERLRAILDNSPAVIYLKDADGRHVFVNRRFEALFHVDNENVRGKTDHDLFPKEIADAYRSNDLKVLREGVPHELEEVAPQDDGIHTYITIKFPLKSAQGETYAVCGIATDITERKRAEEQLRRVNEELVRNEKKLIEAFSNLEQAHTELKETQSQLIRAEKFAAMGKIAGMISHEFRNQLGVIRNSVYFLTMKLESDDVKITNHLKILEKEIQETDRIIENILSFARKSQPELKSIDLRRLLEASLEKANISGDVRVAMKVDKGLPSIQGDEVLLTRVFVNIILNAVQAMKSHGRLMIRVSSSSGFIQISFEDTGPGIREEDKRRIFDPLFSTKTRGAGLGLATARVLVEGHGGTIRLESRFGFGTVVVIRLPIMA